VKAQGLHEVLRRALWWFGLSFLIIFGRAVGASADTIDIVDTAQLADMCTRLASGIPLTMTTRPGEEDSTVGEDELASADSSWTAPETDYQSIMQHALSGFTNPQRAPVPAVRKAAEVVQGPQARQKPKKTAKPQSAERKAEVKDCTPGVKVASVGAASAVWVAAFGAPGLIAIVVSIFGIIINRPGPED